MMSKTQAREYLTRARQGIRDAETALAVGEPAELRAAVQEIAGCAGTIESAMDSYGEGINGVCDAGEYHRG